MREKNLLSVLFGSLVYVLIKLWQGAIQILLLGVKHVYVSSHWMEHRNNSLKLTEQGWQFTKQHHHLKNNQFQLTVSCPLIVFKEKYLTTVVPLPPWDTEPWPAGPKGGGWPLGELSWDAAEEPDGPPGTVGAPPWIGSPGVWTTR